MADQDEFTKLLLEIATDILRSPQMAKDITINGSFVKDGCVYWYYQNTYFVYINPYIKIVLLLENLSQTLAQAEVVNEQYAEVVAMDIIGFFINAVSVKKLAFQIGTYHRASSLNPFSKC